MLAGRWTRLALEFGIVAIVVLSGIRESWLCDDAFVSFRYADQLLAGNGLVFNPGERVEGMTNLAWTVFIALGMALGASAEAWSTVFGIAATGGTTIALLALHRRFAHLTGRALGLPIAAIAFALHPDVAVWATSGLETAAVTMLLSLALLALADALVPAGELPSPRARRIWTSGVLIGLAAATRPDAVLFAPAAAFALCWTLWRATGGWRGSVPDLTRLTVGVLLVWVPVQVFRIWYYGDFFPNTYYAKSAGVPWWSQGAQYFALYLERYAMHWGLAIVVAIALVAARTRRAGAHASRDSSDLAHVLVGLGFALVYTLYLVRVGGDFMFARLLIPTVPFVLWVAEVGLARFGLGHQLVATALLVVPPLILPAPVTLERARHGVSNEQQYYADPQFEAQWAQRGKVLGKAIEGLPVRIAFLGGYARTVRDARVPVAIESETGLTDATIARQPLEKRGRVGHEKHAPPSYLIHEREAHFLLGSRFAPRVVPVHTLVPDLRVVLPDPDGVLPRGLTLWVLRWDPSIMDALRARGAQVPDFLAGLDRLIASLDDRPDEVVRQQWTMLRAFYFDHVPDPERRAAFERRLAKAMATH